jgi:hypothetical protein
VPTRSPRALPELSRAGVGLIVNRALAVPALTVAARADLVLAELARHLRRSPGRDRTRRRRHRPSRDRTRREAAPPPTTVAGHLATTGGRTDPARRVPRSRDHTRGVARHRPGTPGNGRRPNAFAPRHHRRRDTGRGPHRPGTRTTRAEAPAGPTLPWRALSRCTLSRCTLSGHPLSRCTLSWHPLFRRALALRALAWHCLTGCTAPWHSLPGCALSWHSLTGCASPRSVLTLGAGVRGARSLGALGRNGAPGCALTARAARSFGGWGPWGGSSAEATCLFGPGRARAAAALAGLGSAVPARIVARHTVPAARLVGSRAGTAVAGAGNAGDRTACASGTEVAEVARSPGRAAATVGGAGSAGHGTTRARAGDRAAGAWAGDRSGAAGAGDLRAACFAVFGSVGAETITSADGRRRHRPRGR